MANEAVLIFETGRPIPMTVADSGGIEKGSIGKLLDPLTFSGTTATGNIAAGITATEKIALDGKTKIGVFREGIFKVTLTGGCTVGDSLMLAASNCVGTATGGTSGSTIIGTALETGTTGETILMELKPQGGGI